MGLTRIKKKRVAGSYVAGASLVAHASGPGEDHVEFPLCRMRVGQCAAPGGIRTIAKSKGCLFRISRDCGSRPKATDTSFMKAWYLPFGDLISRSATVLRWITCIDSFLVQPLITLRLRAATAH